MAHGEAASSTTTTSDVKSLVSKPEIVNNDVIDVKTSSKGEDYTEIVYGKMGLNGSTNLDAKMVSKVEDYINIVNSERITCAAKTKSIVSQNESNLVSEIKKLTVGEDLNSQSITKNMKNASIDVNGVQLMRNHVATSRKKLLILDVNGLLADIVSPPPKDCKSDKNILRRAIFKRPFLDDFLGFCFDKFDVAIWSSRTRKILNPVVDYLFGDLKKKLLFIWDLSHCTNSSARSLENRHKLIVFKELRKIWGQNGHNLASENGFYDESNTLLLDDSPYKALLNPKHTGIFPLSYSYMDIKDNSLGPDGSLRDCLEGVAATEDIKMYIKQHPFGQHAIDETSPHWAFYSGVLECVP